MVGGAIADGFTRTIGAAAYVAPSPSSSSAR
jgi:hypothetical protein